MRQPRLMECMALMFRAIWNPRTSFSFQDHACTCHVSDKKCWLMEKLLWLLFLNDFHKRHESAVHAMLPLKFSPPCFLALITLFRGALVGMHGIDVPSYLKSSDVLFLSRSCLHMPCLRQKVLADGEAVVIYMIKYTIFIYIITYIK